MNFFSTDGALYQFLSRFWDLVKVNLLWLLCSLPIVTIGASTVAAYSITLKMSEDTEGYIARAFFSAFKANLKQGIPMGLLCMAGLYASWMNFQLFDKANDNPIIFLVMGLVVMAVVAFSFIYAFALLARYDNTILGTIKNSYYIATKYFLRTLFLFVIVVVEIVLFLWNRLLMGIAFFVGPALIMFTVSAFAIRIFREIEKEPGSIRQPGEE